jgi:hypothetical protein
VGSRGRERVVRAEGGRLRAGQALSVHCVTSEDLSIQAPEAAAISDHVNSVETDSQRIGGGVAEEGSDGLAAEEVVDKPRVILEKGADFGLVPP